MAGGGIEPPTRGFSVLIFYVTILLFTHKIMPLPDGFDSFEHLQDTIRKIFRREVIEEFRDLDPDDLDINLPRSSLKTACMPQDDDTGVMLLMRLFLYFFILRKAQDLQPAIAGFPLEDYGQKVTFRPQITLFFQEEPEDVEEGYSPLRSYFSIRIPDETHETITQTKLDKIADKIKLTFGGETPFKFKRGKICCHYHDKVKGFKFFVYAFSETEGKNLIEKALSLFGETPKWEFLHLSNNSDPLDAYPINPGTEFILGKTRKKPRKRPVGTVVFSYATAEIYGLNNPVFLYSIARKYRYKSLTS